MIEIEKRYYTRQDIMIALNIPKYTFSYWRRNFKISPTHSKKYTLDSFHRLKLIHSLIRQEGYKMEMAKVKYHEIYKGKSEDKTSQLLVKA